MLPKGFWRRIRDAFKTLINEMLIGIHNMPARRREAEEMEKRVNDKIDRATRKTNPGRRII